MRKRPAHERFFEKVEQRGDCWVWTGACTPEGYGEFWNGRSQSLAHRWVYEYMVAPIPDGLHLDHLCRVRRCVNPSHLDPVPRDVNTARGEVGSNNRRKSRCPSGHPYDEQNTYRNGRGGRICRTCNRERHRVPREREVA